MLHEQGFLTWKLIGCRFDKWASHANDYILSYCMGYMSCKSFLTTWEKCAGVEFCMNRFLFSLLQMTLLPQESSSVIVTVQLILDLSIYWFCLVQPFTFMWLYVRSKGCWTYVNMNFLYVFDQAITLPNIITKLKFMTWWKIVLQHNVLSLVYHSGNSASSFQEMRCKCYSDVPRHNNINSNNVNSYVRTPPMFLKICILLSLFTHLQGLRCNHMLKAPIVYRNLKCYMKLEQTVYLVGI